MRQTVTFQTDSIEKINLLIKVAHEMGVSTTPDDMNEEDRGWKMLSEKTLAADWLKPEEDIWDNFIKSKLK